MYSLLLGFMEWQSLRNCLNVWAGVPSININYTAMLILIEINLIEIKYEFDSFSQFLEESFRLNAKINIKCIGHPCNHHSVLANSNSCYSLGI